MVKKVIAKDGVFALLLTQPEVDFLLALVGPTPSTIGQDIYGALRPHRQCVYDVLFGNPLPKDAVDELEGRVAAERHRLEPNEKEFSPMPRAPATKRKPAVKRVIAKYTKVKKVKRGP